MNLLQFQDILKYIILVSLPIALYLFYSLFKSKHRLVYIKPWKFIFAGYLLWVCEQVLSILREEDIFYTPRSVNLVFELSIIILFLVMLLLQEKYVMAQIS